MVVVKKWNRKGNSSEKPRKREKEKQITFHSTVEMPIKPPSEHFRIVLRKKTYITDPNQKNALSRLSGRFFIVGEKEKEPIISRQGFYWPTIYSNDRQIQEYLHTLRHWNTIPGHVDCLDPATNAPAHRSLASGSSPSCCAHSYAEVIPLWFVPAYPSNLRPLKLLFLFLT